MGGLADPFPGDLGRLVRREDTARRESLVVSVAKEVASEYKRENQESRVKDFPAVPVLEANTAYRGFPVRREGKG